MTLQQWKDEILENLKFFSQYWEEQIEMNPEHFPDDLLLGDWDEQFNSFCRDRLSKGS